MGENRLKLQTLPLSATHNHFYDGSITEDLNWSQKIPNTTAEYFVPGKIAFLSFSTKEKSQI